MHIDENKKFDKRSIERNLREGTVSAKEWEQYLKKLPDISDKVDFVLLEESQAGKTIENKGGRPKEPVEGETTDEEATSEKE